MATIKSAREIAMEKTKKIDKLSPQEIAEIKQQEKMNNILAKYYTDKIEPDDLWHYFKEISGQYLVKAQHNFLQSITFRSNAYEMEKRSKGILAIENLKKSNQSSDIGFHLEQLKKIQEEYLKNKEQLRQHFKEKLGQDPQQRLQAFQQGNQIMIKEMSIEETLEQNQEFNQQLKQTEKQSKKKFAMVKEKLTEILNA